MVLHDINKLMKNIPEIENVVTFYDDGTVFQTTFDKNIINIPKLGNDLATIISLFKNLKAKNDFKEFVKIIYDGSQVSLIIFKAGEQSNIALFFKRELSDKELQNLHIRSYIDRIQNLIDIDQKGLLKIEIEKKKDELSALEISTDKKINELYKIINDDQHRKLKEELEKEIVVLEQEKKKLREEIEKLSKKLL